MNRRIRMLLKLVTVLGLIVLVPLLAACSQGASESKPQASSSGSSATVKIVEPTDGAEIAAGTLAVRVEVSDLKLSMPSNTNVAGEGHVHFTLDDRPFEMSVEPKIEFKDVTAGEHTLKAELVQNNTDSFDPPIYEEITFTAK